jgi:MFS family permease
MPCWWRPSPYICCRRAGCCFRAAPPPASNVERIAHRGDEISLPTKRRFKQLGWLGNGTGYLMQGSLMALAPMIGERLGWPPSSTIWLICTFFVARAAAFALLWRFTGWHYRLPWILAALAAGPLALTIIFSATLPLLLLPALVVFGACIGLSYYSSIYYSLDYGDDKGEHGGLHESIIGLGGLLGPLAGVAGAAWTGRATGAIWFIVGSAAGVTLLGLVGVLRRDRRI